jgi:radical SAM/CxCxxxxC motif protein YfkAB
MKITNSAAAGAREWPVSPANDPWDPIHALRTYGRYVLTSVEMTTTQLCNMRCEHCAVGDSLSMSEGEKLPLALMLKRLDEVEHLTTISITGGEPSYSERSVKEYILPLLKYARDRGVRSQLNSNITLDLARYELIAPYLDVLHMSFNYIDADDFYTIGFARANHPVRRETAVKMYNQMMNNAAALSRGGLFVSAETMINFRTQEKLPEIHRLICEMGCQRHEVHPMYPSSFAGNLPLLGLGEIRRAVELLLDHRNRDVWMLFGTLPFFQCSSDAEDRRLLQRLRTEPNVTVRNDPDGRNRLNVNLFTGDVYVTDFAAVKPLGNIVVDSLDPVFDAWGEHPLSRKVGCYCPEANCCGPNLLVVDSYYRETDFRERRAIM